MTQPQKFPEGSCNKQSNKESKRKISYIWASFTQHWEGGHSAINHSHIGNGRIPSAMDFQ